MQLLCNALNGGEEVKVIRNAECVHEFDPKRVEGGGVCGAVLAWVGIKGGTELSAVLFTNRRTDRERHTSLMASTLTNSLDPVKANCTALRIDCIGNHLQRATPSSEVFVHVLLIQTS